MQLARGQSPATGRVAAWGKAGAMDWKAAGPSVAAPAGIPLHSLAQAGLHEIYSARAADAAASAGFALAATLQRLPQQIAASQQQRLLVLWVRQRFVAQEAGSLHAPGLMELGFSPAQLACVMTPDVPGALQAGLEAARCTSLAAAIVEVWGPAPAYDLTASRKLALAARQAGMVLLVVRHAAPERASAAETRWQVAGEPARLLPAQAPGLPCFSLSLLRRRSGAGLSANSARAAHSKPPAPSDVGHVWCVEWNRDARRFEIPAAAISRSENAGSPFHMAGSAAAPLHGRVVSLSAQRADEAAQGLRHTG